MENNKTPELDLNHMKEQPSTWRSLIGLDFHVATTLLMRGWTIIAGGIMVIVIPLTLTPPQQGYYFTLASLLSLQIFFELGLNQVITQITSKELSLRNQGSAPAQDAHFHRIRSVLLLLNRWYRAAATLFFAATVLCGIVMFTYEGTLSPIEWLGPWVSLTLFTAINLYYSPRLAATEGCGQVGQVARLRLTQSVIGFSVTWACLFAGGGLWAIPINPLISCIITRRWLNSDNHVLHQFIKPNIPRSDHSINWKREILPFQWRLAISWMSGFLIYQLFTPLIFIHLGAVLAGQLGLTIAIFTAMQSLGVSWFNARIPLITKYIAQNDNNALNVLFRATFIRAMTLTTCGCVCIVIAVLLMRHYNLHAANRLVDIATLIVIAVGAVANTAIYGAATYMRAHGEEPMVPISLLAGILTLPAAYFASRVGTFPTMLSQTLIGLTVVLPWTIHLFNRYYSKHQ